VHTSAALVRRAESLALRRGSARDPALRVAGVRRVRRGVYCLDPQRQPSYEESVVAALLTLPAGSVAYGFTALRLWGLDSVLATTDHELEFLVPGRAGSIRQASSQLHFAGFTGVGLPQGVPATSEARTLVDVVARLEFGDGLVLVETALRRDPTLVDDLHAEHARRLPRRGAATVSRVLRLAGTLSESVLESRARVLWIAAGLPAPIQQATIRHDGRFVARVDFLWEAARLVVEVDGMGKYDEPFALQDEKQRQNRLVASGYTVLRFTWSDVTRRPDHVVEQVRRAVRRAS
jgi:very-short-patch-repair endonuclease